MKTFFVVTVVLCSIVLIGGNASAQIPEDALRLSTPNLAISARSLSMGGAYTGVASDFSAMFTNPAGLGQIRLSEVSFGLSNFSYNNSASYPSYPTSPSTTTSFSNSSTNINNFGFVYPFPTTKGSLVFAIGYGRDADYTTALSYNGFNPNNTMIAWLPDVIMAYNLYLTDTTASRSDGSLYTPFIDSLKQKGKVLEGGGTNNWTVSGAIEAANNLFLGASLNFVAGSYTYTSDYSETDIGKYSVARFGSAHALDGFNLQNTIDDDISGFSARFGLLYKFNGKGRFGLSVKTPTWYSISETYTSDGKSYFQVPDSSGNSVYTDGTTNRTEYSVTTPFVFSVGGSYNLGDLMLTGDIEYTDWTQMNFSNADPAVLQYNTDIKSIFRATANFRGGAEYEIPNSGFRIRGGYAYIPSPYQNDISGADQKYITAGLGFIVDNSVAFDIGYAHGTWNTSHVAYSTLSSPANPKDVAPVSNETIKTNTIVGTILYRF
jgi:hypothetical protein